MSYSTILPKIKARLDSVADIGQVHDYIRWARDTGGFYALFRDDDNDQIRAWDISRTKTPETAKASRTNIRTHTFRIRGFMALDDSAATEKDFQNLLEAVATAFRNYPDLDGVALIVDPLQIVNVTHAMIGDVLCHFAECDLMVEEEVQWTEA